MKSEDGTGSRHPCWRCGNVTPPISFVKRGCKKTALRKASVHESGQMPFFLTNTVENSEN